MIYQHLNIYAFLSPLSVIIKYNLLSLSYNGFVSIRINKDIYFLPQAGKITHDELVQHLVPFDYHSTTHTPGFWTHATRPLSFVLTVYDFGIRYTDINDTNHLFTS